MGEQSETNNSDNSITLCKDDSPMKKDKEETSIPCADEIITCAREESVGPYSRNETQRAGINQGEPPPPYERNAPPPYYSSYRSEGPQQQSSGPYSSRRRSRNNRPFGNDLSYEEVAIVFEDVSIRHAFVQKVFTILFAQLSITTALNLLALFHKPTGDFIRETTYMSYIMMAIFFTTYLALICIKSLRRKFPVNYIFLFLLTISMSYLTAFMTVRYETKIVVSAVGTTMLICFIVSLLACQTWFDITKWTFIIAIASIIVMVFGLIAMIMSIFGYKIIWMIYCGLVVLLCSVFLLYDMQCILGGRRIELSPEEYIYGALNLYIDIIYIFWYLLQLYAYCR
ncbi:unnamed protein product [Ceutorhynchus assimilis]|uniref:Uncharacterized protein n=1 Tax=Ceutorhynchus assimilis TaxID=467358 RepID=A0A9N9MWW7_9CUCU|nr:unnamed protein product [Ceutorhynchus assimilis]